MKVTIPNPDRPAEVEEIEDIMHQLHDCNVRGGWNMEMLSKWLKDKPDAIWNALERLREAHEVMYPPTVIEVQTEAKEDVAA